jgi:hypothetical protein
MPSPEQPRELLVTGTHDGDDLYDVKTKWVGGIMPARSRKISAVALMQWLAKHGCEFCAHQVKMRRNFTCDHLERPRLALTDLDLLALT